MKQQTLAILGGISLFSFFGIIVGYSTVFALLYLGIIFLITGGLFFITIISDLILKTRSRIIGGVLFAGFFISLSTCLITFNIQKSIKQKEADQLVEKLESYRNAKGHYPFALSGLDTDADIKKFSYNPDSLGKSYDLSYITNGWNVRRYSSKTGKWVYTD